MTVRKLTSIQTVRQTDSERQGQKQTQTDAGKETERHRDTDRFWRNTVDACP